VAHRAEHEVCLGAVEASAPEDRAGLDHPLGRVAARAAAPRGEEVRPSWSPNSQCAVPVPPPQSLPRARLKRARPSESSMSGSG
jgi:hypothetical protein